MTPKSNTPLRLPSLPKLVDSKLYKTGQTRGAEDDEIFQNRVLRSSTVLIPYACWEVSSIPQDGSDKYENGYIVLISPDEYFHDPEITSVLADKGLVLGSNAVVFYETRRQWNAFNPDTLGWQPANARSSPLGGQYVARVPATTAKKGGDNIFRGYNTSSIKGAGIRVYEYASAATIGKCRMQLEGLFWLCADSEKVVTINGMTATDAALRKEKVVAACRENDLLNMDRLLEARIINKNGATICPLCLDELSAQGFSSRIEQAEGRGVPDLTVTELNLFHISELRVGVLNHRPYNVGWGHHHCNVVVKDSGIAETLKWMQGVLSRNTEQGHLATGNKAI